MQELAADAWDAAELPDLTPLALDSPRPPLADRSRRDRAAAPRAACQGLAEWIGKRAEDLTKAAGAAAVQAVNIPEERPAEFSPSPMFDANTVYFGRRAGGKGRDGAAGSHMDCASNGQAKLIVRLANVGLSGWVNVPADVSPARTPVPQCLALLNEVDARLLAARRRFDELAESRTGDPRLQAQIEDQLLRWFVHGRRPPGGATVC